MLEKPNYFPTQWLTRLLGEREREREKGGGEGREREWIQKAGGKRREGVYLPRLPCDSCIFRDFQSDCSFSPFSSFFSKLLWTSGKEGCVKKREREGGRGVGGHLLKCDLRSECKWTRQPHSRPFVSFALDAGCHAFVASVHGHCG